MRNRKFKISKLFLFLISVIVLLYVVWSLGKPLLPPWELSVDILEPKYASVGADGKLNAFSDNDLLRLSYLDDDEKVDRTESLSLLSDTDERFYNVSTFGNKIYALFIEYDQVSGYIKKETIKCWEDKNENFDVLYSQEYEPTKEKLKRPKVLDLFATNNGLYAVFFSQDEHNSIKVININEGNIKEVKKYEADIECNSIQDACYNPNCDKIVVSIDFGHLYIGDKTTKLSLLQKDVYFNRSCLTILDDGSIIASGIFSPGLYCIKNNNDIFKIEDDTFPNTIQYENGYLINCDSETSKIIIYDYASLKKAIDENTLIKPTKEFKDIPLNFQLIFWILFTWLCYLYMFVVLITILVKAFKKITLQDTTKVYINMGIVLVIAIFVVSAFFTSNLYNQAESSVYGNLKTVVLNTYTQNKEKIIDFSKENTDTRQKMDDYWSIYNNTQSLVETFAKGDTSIDIDVFSKQDINNIENILSEEKGRNILFAKDLFMQILQNNNDDIIMLDLDSEIGPKYCALMLVYDTNGEACGLIIASSPAKQLLLQQLDNYVNYNILLLIVGCTLVLLFLEFRAAKRDFSLSLKIKRKKHKGKLEVCGFRVFSFIYHLIYCVDTALVILISKDILNYEGAVSGAVILSIPVSLYAFGYFLGTTVAQTIINKFNARNVFVLTASFHFISELILVASITNNNFIMFCIFKCITGISIGILSFVVNIIQYQVDSFKEQSLIANNSSLALISSSALSSMIAGSLSDNYGNQAIYIFMALLCVLFIIVSFWYLPKNIVFKGKKIKENNKLSDSSIKSLFKFIFSPVMLVVVLCTCLIATLAYQYNSVLYPLFADNSGLSKTNIGNITMLAVCAVYFINNILKNYLSKQKQSKVVLASLLIFGIPLLCFSLNQSIIWASLILIAITFSYRTIIVSQKLIWVPLAKQHSVSEDKVYMIMIQIKMICTAIAPTIFSLIINFGHAESAMIVGFICMLSSLIFWLVSRKSNL